MSVTALFTGNSDPSAPLVVLLHGRGSSEAEIIGLAEHLPPQFAYVALRAPLNVGPGAFAWFENRGIGRPLPESLRTQLDWFTTWLDEVAPTPRRVLLVGFSGGAAFAGGLALDRPDRYAGVALLYGTVPFDAGVPTTPDRLAGLPIFHAQGLHDDVMPRDLMDRTWQYLTVDAGSTTVTYRLPGAHAIHPDVLEGLGHWMKDHALS